MSDIILEQWRDYVCGKYQKKNTRHTYLDHPRVMLRHLDKTTSELTQRDIDRYHEYCYRYRKINGNAIRFWVIREYLTWSHRQDLHVPVISPVDAGKQALDENNTNKLLETIETLSALHRLIFYLENDALRRPSEIRDIKLNDRYGNKLSYLGKTKNVHGRQTCIMTERLQRAWDDYRLIRPIPQSETEQEYLILSDYGRYKGKHLETNQALTRIIQELAMTARIEIPFGEKPTNYLIKRTGITRQLKECPDPKLIQMQAGHSTLLTTMKYNRVSEQDLENYLALYEHKDKKIKPKTIIGEDKYF